MKRFVILVLLVAVAHVCSGQTFQVTPNGITGVDSVIGNAYDKAQTYVNAVYANPKAAIVGDVPGKYLKVRTHEVFTAKKGILREDFVIAYNLNIEVKEGVTLLFITDAEFKPVRNTLAFANTLAFKGPNTFDIYDTRDKLKSTATLVNLEAILNKKINDLRAALYE